MEREVELDSRVRRTGEAHEDNVGRKREEANTREGQGY